MPIYGDRAVSDDALKAVMSAARQRAFGRPLQYIIGTWDFLSLTLEVGEGVLIPRPETELLCKKAADILSGIGNPRILDLCAGSGCVGLGIASLCGQVSVTAVELSPPAFEYLKRNISRYPEYKVQPVLADVLKDADLFDGMYDAIVANPPYIPSSDIPGLMREVRHEPVEALDGGDGFKFYRAIIKDWLKKIVPGGFCAVEVGLGQAASVAKMFADEGLQKAEIFDDTSGIPRVVTATVR